jgi:hypothetical protein
MISATGTVAVTKAREIVRLMVMPAKSFPRRVGVPEPTDQTSSGGV